MPGSSSTMRMRGFMRASFAHGAGRSWNVAPAAGRARDLEPAAVVADDPLDDGEAEAGAARLGREVGREEAGPVLLAGCRARCPRRPRRRLSGSARVRRRSVPPSGIASRALATRLPRARARRSASARTGREVGRAPSRRAPAPRAAGRARARGPPPRSGRVGTSRGRGSRASSVKASMIRLSERSSPSTVSLVSRRKARLRRAPGRSSARRSVSSESWMGKRGFLSSWARRRGHLAPGRHPLRLEETRPATCAARRSSR